MQCNLQDNRNSEPGTHPRRLHGVPFTAPRIRSQGIEL